MTKCPGVLLVHTETSSSTGLGSLLELVLLQNVANWWLVIAASLVTLLGLDAFGNKHG